MAMTDRDRMIEILQDTLHEWECDVSIKTLTEIAEHLIENGVIVLPCKVGDKVYQTDWIRIYESTIRELEISSTNTVYCTENVAFDDRAIGNSIFLTREEAEKALEKKK